MDSKNHYRRTYIREWRIHRGMSLDQLASLVPMDKSNLSKVERGLLPYNQEMIERLAEALKTDVASLLMREPNGDSGIWRLWQLANPSQKRQIEAVAEALISADH